MSERNIRLKFSVDSELQKPADELERLIRLEQNLVEAIKQASLSSRADSAQQVTAIQAVSDALDKQRAARKKADDEAADSTKKISDQLTTLTSGVKTFAGFVASAFAIAEIKSFGEGIIEAKTQIDSIHISLQTMLGSKKEADTLYASIVQLAKSTPFSLQELGEQVVKLKAYNIETADLIPTITALGNISAAVGKEKLPQLTLAYGQVANAGKLMGTELRQFVEAGVPLIDLIAKAYDKTKDSVIKMAADHEISFAMVKKALLDASAEGGKYQDLMVKLSKTVGGEVSNLKDAFQLAQAGIGNFFEKQISEGTDSLKKLVEGLAGSNSAIARTVDIVKSVTAAFIAYTLATKAQNVVDELSALYQKAKTIAQGEYLIAMRAATAQQVVFTAAQTEAVVAAEAFNVALKANWIGIAVTAVAALVSALYAYKAVNDEVTTSLGEQELQLRTENSQLQALGEVALTAAEGTNDRKVAIEQLIKKYPEYFAGIDAEKISNTDLKDILDKVNGSYQTRISLARQAYKMEGLQEELKKNLQQEAEILATLPIELQNKYGGDINKAVADMFANPKIFSQINNDWKGQLGFGDFSFDEAKKVSDNLTTITSKLNEVDANITKSQTARIQSSEAAENARWKGQQAALDKGSASYKAAEEQHLINLAKINGTYNENVIKNAVDHAETLKNVTLVSAKEIAVLKGENDELTLKQQLDFLNKQEAADIDAINKVKVRKGISAKELEALERQAKEKILALDAEYDKKRAVIMEQMEQEKQSAYIVKAQETYDKIKVLEAQQAEALRVQALLEGAKTNEQRLGALREYNDKFVVESKNLATEQLRIQAEASKFALDNIAVETGMKGDAYRTAHAAWLKDDLAYQTALTSQTIAAAKETAQQIQAFEKEIQQAKQETAKVELETLEIQKRSRQEFVSSFLSIFAQDSGIVGQIAGMLKTAFDGFDQMKLKALSTAQDGYNITKTSLENIKLIYDDGTAKGAAMIADAELKSAEAKQKLETSKAETLAGVANMFAAAYQIATAVAGAINNALSESWKAISEGLGKVRQAYADMYAAVQKSQQEAHVQEMTTFDQALNDKILKLDQYYAKEIERATGADRIAAQASYETAIKDLMSSSLAERLKMIDDYYARDLEQAIGQKKIDAQITYFQQVADLQSKGGQSAKDILDGLQAANEAYQKNLALAEIDAAEMRKAKAKEVYDTRIDYINKELEAFKTAKQAEIDALNEALGIQKAANEQFYSDKQLRLQEDDAYRQTLLVAGESREVAALEAAKQRELKRAEESGATAEEVANITNAFNKLIADKHAEYQTAQGNKTKEISLANQETKAQEKDKEESLTVDTANRVQAIMQQIAAQEAAAAEDRLKANADYIRQVMIANNAMFEANKRMKIAELQAEIAVLEGQKGLFSNNSAINAAISSIQAAIGTISGLTYDTGGVSIAPIRSVFGLTTIAKGNSQINLNPNNQGGSTGTGVNIGTGPGNPINQATGQAISQAFDENGNEISLTYNKLGNTFSAFDKDKNAINVAFATGFAVATGKRYFDGTDYVERGDNPSGRDTIPAMVNEGERILPTRLNQLLGGAKLSNEHLVDKVLAFEKLAATFPQLAVKTSFPQMELPASIMNGSSGGSVDMSKMLSEMKGVRADLKNQKLLNVNIDRNGTAIYELGVQSKITHYSNIVSR